jgi:hypothetical protein
MIVDQHITLVQAAGHAKGKYLIIDLAGVDHSGLGQWSKRHRHGHIAGKIIYHLVPIENFKRVGLWLPGHYHTDHLVFRIQKISYSKFDVRNSSVSFSINLAAFQANGNTYRMSRSISSELTGYLHQGY